MNKYSSYVSQIAKRIESNTMSKHMQGKETIRISDEDRKKREEQIKKAIAEDGFAKLFHRCEWIIRHSNLDYFKNNEWERDIIDSISQKLIVLNEYCLQDKDFSEAIATGSDYSKELCSLTGNDATYYDMSSPGYTTKALRYGWEKNPLCFKIDYFPSKTNDEPNVIRFFFKSSLYSATIDICSNGSIIYKNGTIREMKTVHDDSGKIKFIYEHIPCSMEDFLESKLINPHAFEYLKDLFMLIFEKAELKTIDNSKKK